MRTELYEKYKATNYQDLPAINPLSFILRKAELGYWLTTSEWDWLEQHELTETKEKIKNQENYRDILRKKTNNNKALPPLHPLSIVLRKAELRHDLILAEWDWLNQHQLFTTKEIFKNQENYIESLRKEIHCELLQLQKNQFVCDFITTVPAIDSKTALILYKVNAGERLANSELLVVGNVYHRLLDFNDKKQKYGITNNLPFDARLFHILQKLDKNTLLNRTEIDYLKVNGFIEPLEIAQKMEFSALKVKYRAMQIQEDNITNHLFKVLKKIDAGLPLPEPDINYLKKRKLLETVKFVYKKEVDSLIEQINQGDGLTPDDIVWCKQHDFKELLFKWLNRKIEQGKDLSPEDVTWCKAHQFEDIVFKWLKQDYGVNYRQDALNSPLYIILQKLQAGKRLTDDEVAWLEIEKWLIEKERFPPLPYSSSKVFITHHTLEAQFNESEFQRTKDHWKLASASAHWRKAENPIFALKQTDNLDFKKIKPAKLTAALFTTRGGALRDAGHLNEAEYCALEAMKNFPDSHNPYTLIGALCLQTGRVEEGLKWFDEAIKRGATPRDQDAEIRRILLKKTGKERNELIDQLLRYRFAWVKNFRRDNQERTRKNSA